MACELNKAIKLLYSKAGTKKRIEQLIAEKKNADKEYAGLVQDMTGKTPDAVSLKEFSEKLSAYIFKVANIKVENNPQFALEQIHLGMKEFAPAKMDMHRGKIVIADVTDVDSIANKLSTEFYKKVSSGELKGVDVSNATLNAEVQKVFDVINNARETHFFQHELLHAGTLEYMYLNPNNEETKRIENIFICRDFNFMTIFFIVGNV